MIDDGMFRYVYDAWNRLIKVQASEDSAAVTVQTAEFDAIGRRMKKVVTNSGDSDGTVVYLYDGQKIIETRDESGNMVQQMIHGTRYIDELIMVRVANKGDLYVHQDANWNVIGLTDLGGRLVERHTYSPYGELTVDQKTNFGDYNGDGDVDSTDEAAYLTGGDCEIEIFSGVSGACRILDLNFDDKILFNDLSIFTNSLEWGNGRHPGRVATSVRQPFAHQGLLHEPEIGSYQNRARQYDPVKRRFAQRDPLLLMSAIGRIDRRSLVQPAGPICRRGCAGICDLYIAGCYALCGDELPCGDCNTVSNACGTLVREPARSQTDRHLRSWRNGMPPFL